MSEKVRVAIGATALRAVAGRAAPGSSMRWRGAAWTDRPWWWSWGEFGRTPKINSNGGRDHWGLCQSVLLAGGGIRGGQVHGASDRIGAYPACDPVDPVDVHATVYRCMGLDPEERVHDHLRRPYPISTGRVIAPLV